MFATRPARRPRSFRPAVDGLPPRITPAELGTAPPATADTIDYLSSVSILTTNTTTTTTASDPELLAYLSSVQPYCY